MIVADTHVILWDALQPKKLSAKARQAIAAGNQGAGIIVCDISLWEIAMLMKKGRIQVEADYLTFIRLVLQSNRYTLHQITPEIADLSVQLPPEINKDPADRIIAATTMLTKGTLITADQNLQQAAGLSTLW